MPHLSMFVPITKVDATQRLVYGLATAEIVDRSGEICDYDSTKPYYEDWSNGIAQSTGGKSLGNLRAMHGTVAAGKVTALTFNDDDKQIEICAKVVDDDEWHKVQEGVYTGFSQGGTYIRRWTDEDGLTRYTAAPSEISLVDLPCLAQARFEMIKQDGTQEWRGFAKPGAQRSLPEIAKLGARNSEADLTRIQAMHDTSVELGASCGGDSMKIAHAGHDALEKKFDALSAMLADVLSRVKKIEEQPMPLPLSGRTRAVSKQEDGGFDSGENAAIEKLLADPQALSLLESVLKSRMGISSDEIATHGDENHGVRDVDALFVVTHEAPPSCHPSEGPLDHPASGQDLEALLVVGSPYDLNDEIEVGSLVHQLQPIIGAIGEQVLYPGPAFADAIEDGLGASAIGDIGGGEVDH